MKIKFLFMLLSVLFMIPMNAATDKKGRRKSHIRHQAIQKELVNQIIEDHEGHIWFATNNGVSRWDAASNKWKHYYQNKSEQAKVFLSLCEDNQGHIWAGSYSSGIYLLDRETGKTLKHYSSKTNTPGFTGDFIFDFFHIKITNFVIHRS